VGGKEQDVIEGQRLLDHPHGYPFTQNEIIRKQAFDGKGKNR
jgi:hypothetical protein